MTWIGVVSIWIVWVVVKCWVMGEDDRVRRDERIERRESDEWYKVDDRRRHHRRIRYLKMYDNGRLHDIMSDDQVEQFVEDVYD